MTAGAGDLEAFDDDNADDAEPKLVLIIEKDVRPFRGLFRRPLD